VNLDTESALLLFFFLVIPVVVALCAAKGLPKGWRRTTYLIVFAITLIVDSPLLLLLYLTPKESLPFGLVDLFSITAFLAFGGAWGCFWGFLVFGKLSQSRKSTTKTTVT